DAGLMELPIARADAALRVVLERHAEELLMKYPRRETLVDQVRSLIKAELTGGDPSLAKIGRELGMSRRTLQRHLKAGNTSHHQILEETRKHLALEYLSRRGMTIGELAYLLGFSEQSAFCRAFKRWTGMSPTDFRRK